MRLALEERPADNSTTVTIEYFAMDGGLGCYSYVNLRAWARSRAPGYNILQNTAEIFASNDGIRVQSRDLCLYQHATVYCG
jgi:hypothetical protein